jgi:HSP20 family protein
MTIKKWDPFRDLIDITHDMDRFFEDYLSYRLRHPYSYRGVWSPVVDMYETGDEIMVLAELPGMKKEDLIVEVEDNHLILRGERQFKRDVKNESYHRIERPHGEFFRALRLPAAIQKDQIKAEYREGVLSVILLKTEPSTARNIEIKTE